MANIEDRQSQQGQRKAVLPELNAAMPDVPILVQFEDTQIPRETRDIFWLPDFLSAGKGIGLSAAPVESSESPDFMVILPAKIGEFSTRLVLPKRVKSPPIPDEYLGDKVFVMKSSYTVKQPICEQITSQTLADYVRNNVKPFSSQSTNYSLLINNNSISNIFAAPVNVYRLTGDEVNKKWMVDLVRDKPSVQQISATETVSSTPTQAPAVRTENQNVPDRFARPTSWGKVIGQYAAVSEFKKIVEQLQHADRYRAEGVHPERGVLLYGSTGTGKSLLGYTLAEKLGCPYVEIDCNVFSHYVNQDVERIIAKFDEAAKLANKEGQVVVILNEIESLAGIRKGNQTHQEDTVNGLMVTLERVFKKYPNIIVVGTTNHKEKIDDAVLRPGKLGLKIRCDVPETANETMDLLKHAVYTILDEANKAREEQKLALYKAGDIISLDKENFHKLSQLSELLIGYPQAAIVEGVQKARRDKIKPNIVTTPLTPDEIYTGILTYQAERVQDHRGANGWFARVK